MSKKETIAVNMFFPLEITLEISYKKNNVWINILGFSLKTTLSYQVGVEYDRRLIS